MIVCTGCGEKFVWFCGGQTITYPMEVYCPGCGVINIDQGPPGWAPLVYEQPKLEWDDIAEGGANG